MLWMAGVKGPGLKGGGGGDRPHPARGPALKGQTVPSRAWLLKPQREGAAGPGRYLAHPTPHGRAALAAPRSREETARGRPAGRGGGRRRQGGARSALRRRHRMATRLVGETGPRPRRRTPSAHAHLNPQFAHARGVGAGLAGGWRGGGRGGWKGMCVEAVATVGGSPRPQRRFPLGLPDAYYRQHAGLDSLGESGAKRSLDSGAPLSGFSEPTVLGGWGFLWPCPTQPRPRRSTLWERWAR